MDREHMKREELEHKLREYFRAEADEAEPSPQWWQGALTNLGQQKRPRRWFPVPAVLLSTKPFQVAIASLTLALVAGSISLLVLSPWRGGLPAAPEQGPMRDSFESSVETPTIGTDSEEGISATEDGKTSPTPVGSTPTAAPMEPPGPQGPPPEPAPDTGLLIEWRVEKDLYVQGEAITLRGAIRNISDKTLAIEGFPGTVSLDLIDTLSDEGVVLLQGTESRSLEPGEATTVRVEVPGSLSGTLSPGRYTVHLAARFDDGREIGFGGGIVFVLLPPQGALEKTVAVNETRKVEGVTITLKGIEFTQRETKIVAIAVPPGYSPPEGPISFPRGNMAGKYRVDEGPWRELTAAYRDTQEGVHLEWTLGPVPADARTFEFAVTQFAVNPSRQVLGLWEWVVPLEQQPSEQMEIW